MKVFAVVFVGLTLYGAWMGLWGGVVIAVGMIALACHGDRVFSKQDQAHANSPASARDQPSTLSLLDQEGCECSAHSFPAEISKPDSET